MLFVDLHKNQPLYDPEAIINRNKDYRRVVDVKIFFIIMYIVLSDRPKLGLIVDCRLFQTVVLKWCPDRSGYRYRQQKN